MIWEGRFRGVQPDRSLPITRPRPSSRLRQPTTAPILSGSSQAAATRQAGSWPLLARRHPGTSRRLQKTSVNSVRGAAMMPPS